MKEKNLSLEFTRVLALALVLFTHTAQFGSKIYTYTDRGGVYYFLCMSLDVIRIISVPLFLMISGAVLLGKQESTAALFKHRIFRIAVILVVMSGIQYVYAIATGLVVKASFSDFAYRLYMNDIRGSYWYLYVYLAFLIVLPFLRGVAKIIDFKMTIYLVALSTLVDIIAAIGEINGVSCGYIYDYISFASCYTLLFPILGYGIFNYTQQHVLKIMHKVILILIWAITICIQDVCVYNEFINTGEYSETFIWKFNGIAAFCVFMLLSNNPIFEKINDKNKKIVLYLGSGVFGTYLIENFLYLVTVYLQKAVYNVTGIVLVSCAAYIIGTIILGSIVINTIRQIPILKKYL